MDDAHTEREMMEGRRTSACNPPCGEKVEKAAKKTKKGQQSRLRPSLKTFYERKEKEGKRRAEQTAGKRMFLVIWRGWES